MVARLLTYSMMSFSSNPAARSDVVSTSSISSISCLPCIAVSSEPCIAVSSEFQPHKQQHISDNRACRTSKSHRWVCSVFLAFHSNKEKKKKAKEAGGRVPMGLCRATNIAMYNAFVRTFRSTKCMTSSTVVRSTRSPPSYSEFSLLSAIADISHVGKPVVWLYER